MDWGLISGCTSLIGLIITLIRVGEWKARQEVRIENVMQRLENSDGKILRRKLSALTFIKRCI